MPGGVSADLDALLSGLRRRPDIETAELRAWDAADRDLLDTAAPMLATGATVVMVDDTHGALTLGALALGAHHVRVHQDSLVGQRALVANAAGDSEFSHHPLRDLMTPDARLALVRLPRSLDRLDAVARALAARAHPDLVLIAGNMHKHMTPAQNEVLRASFDQVEASLARGKARLLTARGPRVVEPPTPVRNLLEVARFRQLCRRLGVREVASAGTQLRIGPVQLPDSAQLRLRRLYPEAQYKAAAQVGTVPKPVQGGRIGGAPVRDVELLGWCAELLAQIVPSSTPVRSTGG